MKPARGKRVASITSCTRWSLNPYLRKSLQQKLEHQRRLFP